MTGEKGEAQATIAQFDIGLPLRQSANSGLV